jgi:hypothetical protein
VVTVNLKSSMNILKITPLLMFLKDIRDG